MRATDAFGVSRGYEQFFGLVESPFSLTPNTRFLFESESHSEALEQVTLALRRREAITVITGEVGTGKTMLCRILVQDLEPRTFISVISNPLLTAADLLKQLLHDFGLMPRDDSRQSTLTQHDMVATLQRFMASLVPLRAHAIVLIDEAQHLQPEVLEQVRLLTNFETDSQKLLQVVLVGQLDLDAVLDRPDLRQLRQRISRRHQLQPLKPYEVEQYIERRLWVAHGGLGLAKVDRPAEFTSGERFWRVRFSPAAMRAIARLSGGLPRAINVICDRALERAHEAQKKEIDASLVVAAARELKIPVATSVWIRSTPWPAVAATAALVLLATGLSLRPFSGTSLTEPASVDGAVQSAGAPPAASSAVAAPAGSTTPAAVASNTPASATVNGAAATGGSEGPAMLPEAESFEVAVAVLTTESRASELVKSLRGLDLPAYAQPDRSGRHVVTVGPFASRDEAREAQAQIVRVHITDSRIVSTSAHSDGKPAAPGVAAVATTGQKGQP